MTFSQYITSLRQHGWTQAQIAAEVHTSQGHISDIERGVKGSRLSYDIASKLIALHERVLRHPPKEAA